MDEIRYKPIGVVHSPYTSPAQAPRQPRMSHGTEGSVEVFDEYIEGLADLEGFSHIVLLCHLHMSSGYSLRVQPPWSDTPKSLFATRSPRRPNPIGLSIVRLTGVETRTLHIRDIDMVDGTPVLDIKPYVPPFDGEVHVRDGWIAGRIQEDNTAENGKGALP